ncbi:DUF6207 family protein [Streptomyces lydicamycinicus]
MEISEEHLREPGLVVIDITAADESTATQAATALGGLWLSSGPSAPWHTPGKAGVTVRAYADLRRTPLPGGTSDSASPAVPQVGEPDVGRSRPALWHGSGGSA